MSFKTSVHLFKPDKLRSWILVLLTGLAALASYWVLEVSRNTRDQGATQERTRPDYFVEDFNFAKIPAEYQHSYRLVGKRFIHCPSDDHAEITLPTVTSLDPTQPAMLIRSEKATIHHISQRKRSEVHLYKNVALDRAATNLSDHLRLTTEYLLANPEQSTVETFLPIKIISGESVTTGVGLKANNRTQHIEILKDVFSIIPPHVHQKSKQYD